VLDGLPPEPPDAFPCVIRVTFASPPTFSLPGHWSEDTTDPGWLDTPMP